MTKTEKAVRDAAATLHDAIVEARKAGYRVEWPSTPDGLASIAISETAKSDTSPDAPAGTTVTGGGGAGKVART